MRAHSRASEGASNRRAHPRLGRPCREKHEWSETTPALAPEPPPEPPLELAPEPAPEPAAPWPAPKSLLWLVRPPRLRVRSGKKGGIAGPLDPAEVHLNHHLLHIRQGSYVSLNDMTSGSERTPAKGD